MIDTTVSLLILFLTLLCVYVWQCNRKARIFDQIKNDLLYLPLIGHGYLFLGDGEDHLNTIVTFGRQALKYGGVTKVWLGWIPYVVIADAEIAAVVLKSCLEKDDAAKIGQEILGKGSIVAEVPIWRPRRKAMATCFTIRKLNQFVDCHVRHSHDFVEKLKPIAGGGPVQLWDYLYSSILDTELESAAGIQLETGHPFFEAFKSSCTLISTRMCQPWLQNDWLWKRSSYYPVMEKNKKIIYDLVDEVIRSTRETMNHKNGTHIKFNSFLSMIMESNVLTDTEIKEEMMGLVFAAIDTTSSALSFIINSLATHTDVQDKVYEEIMQVVGGHENCIKSPNFSELKYTQAVIYETLRLYPAAPMIARKIDKDLQIPSSNISLTKGTGAILNIWAVNRNPKYWGPDAESFRPERFLEGKLSNPLQFLTFSFGSRNCLGYKYAIISLKTVLVTTLQHYKFLTASSSQMRLRCKFDIVMKDIDKVTVRLEHR